MSAPHLSPRFGVQTLAVYETENGMYVPIGPTEDAVLQRFLLTTDTNAAIGRHLDLKEKSVKNVMTRLMGKFGVANRTALYRCASQSRRILRPS